MAQAIDTTNYVYLAMTANFWAWSKASEDAAVKALRGHAGSKQVTKYGWVTYHIHPDFEVCGINGDVMTPIGHKAIKLTDKIKRKAA